MRKITIITLFFGLLATAQAQPANLPPDLQHVRQEVIDICRLNTLRTDNIAQIRQQLDPLVAQLGNWFIANRPINEVALTQVPWKSIWYDDPTIDDFSNITLGPVSFNLARDQVYQVIEDGFYYNISEREISYQGQTFSSVNFLKGAYELKRPSNPTNRGQTYLNLVDLQFVFNGIWPGALPDGVNLRLLVGATENKILPVVSVPGPIGSTGLLWNVYVDDELRIATGFEDVNPGVLDLYILLKVSETGPLLP
jgi:hypothetical protein